VFLPCWQLTFVDVTSADKLREDGEANPDKRVTAPLDKPTAAWVLEPLRLAAGAGSHRLVEPALGCLHKLVSVVRGSDFSR